MKNVVALIACCIALLLIPQISFGQELSGNWKGGWQSCNTGHKGRLNAKFCRIDESHVQAKFTGTFAKIIPFRYKPVLNVVHEEPGLMVLQGTRKLPLGGTFEYNATISNDQFNATYRSKRDQGVWNMTRR